MYQSGPCHEICVCYADMLPRLRNAAPATRIPTLRFHVPTPATQIGFQDDCTLSLLTFGDRGGSTRSKYERQPTAFGIEDLNPRVWSMRLWCTLGVCPSCTKDDLYLDMGWTAVTSRATSCGPNEWALTTPLRCLTRKFSGGASSRRVATCVPWISTT